MCENLKIRIISYLVDPIFFALYQQDIVLNVNNYKLGAFEKGYIAPGASIYTILPLNLNAYGRSKSENTIYNTKIININYDCAYEIYQSKMFFDIKSSAETPPRKKETIDIYNKTLSRKEAVILRGERPIFSADLRPNTKLNFSIDNSINIALSDFEITNDFFQADDISQTYKIDYNIQDYLTILLKENVSSGKIQIETNYSIFHGVNI